MPIVQQGGQVTLPAQGRNGAGQLQDVDNLSLTLRDLSSATLPGFPVVEPAIVHDGIGLYHYDWTVGLTQALGTYTAVWDSIINGGPAIGYDSVEVVPAGSIGTGTRIFMVAPDDYDAVRGLLGVTTLDVENSDIDLAAFAPQAEMEVQRRVSNWAMQMGNPDQLYVLRLASIYKTACYLAESFVRGGTIGLVRPLSVGEGRDWAAAAEMFCAKYEYWVSIADLSDADGEVGSIFDINPMRRSGPMTARIARRRGTTLPLLDAEWLGFPPFWDWRA